MPHHATSYKWPRGNTHTYTDIYTKQIRNQAHAGHTWFNNVNNNLNLR